MKFFNIKKLLLVVVILFLFLNLGFVCAANDTMDCGVVFSNFEDTTDVDDSYSCTNDNDSVVVDNCHNDELWSCGYVNSQEQFLDAFDSVKSKQHIIDYDIVDLNDIDNENLIIGSSSNDNTDFVLGAKAAISTKIVVSSTSVDYSDSLTVRLLTSANKAISGKVLKININGKTYSKTTNSKGYAYLPLNLIPKSYSTSIVFAGASGYTKSSKKVTITVNKMSTKFTIASNVVYSKALSVHLLSSSNKDISSKSVTIIFNGKSYTKTTNVNGYAFFTITDVAKKYPVTVKFNGDAYYKAVTKSEEVTVTKMNTHINANDVHMVYGDGSSLIAYLYDNDNKAIKGKKIDLTISGTSYASSTTGDDGKATFKIIFNPIYYVPVIKFNGDNCYSASSKSCSIKIKGNYSKAIFFGLDDIESAASEVKKYIEFNHKLPENLIISGENISMEQYLDLVSSAIFNIRFNESNSSIYLGNYAKATSSETINGGDLTKSQYFTLINNIKAKTGKGIVPSYINTPIGNIGFQSLVYLCSELLDSYQILNKLPEKIKVVPWSIISNNKTVLVTMEEIFKKSEYVVNYIETKHNLPTSICIKSTNGKNISINRAQFLKLELETFMNFNYTCFQSLMLKNYDNPTNPSETITGGTLTCLQYSNAAINLNNFLESNGRAPNYVSTIRGYVGFESSIYIYAQILVSTNRYFSYPEAINLVPWNMVKDNSNIFISMNNISFMAKEIKNNVMRNHKLPINLKCNGRTFTIPQFLNLEIVAIKNVENKLFQSVLLKSFSAASNPSETLTRGKLLQSNYLTVADNIRSFLMNNGRAPNYVSTSLGQMRYENYIFMYAEILDYSVKYNRLPSYAIIHPWSLISKSNCVFFNETQVINASHYLVNYVEVNHNLPSSIKVGSINLNKNQFLYLLVTTLHKVNGTYSGELVLDTYSSASVTESLSSGILDKKSYLDIARLIGYDMSYNDHVNESTSVGRISSNSALYIYSQILCSYDSFGVLPYFVNVKPWNLISNSNTKFFSIDDVVNASTTLKDYIDKNNNIPSTIVIRDSTISMACMLKLMANSVAMISGNLVSNIAFENYSPASSPSETLKGENIDIDDYVTLALSLMTAMDVNKKIPNYLSSDFGHVRYESLIQLYASVLSYYKNKNALVDNTVILPWSKINGKFFTIDDISNASVVLNRYIEKNHILPNFVVVNGVNLSIVKYVQIASEAILNLNSNLYSSIIDRDYGNSYSSFENLNKVFDIYSLEYLYLVKELNENMNEGRVAPDSLVFELNSSDVYLGFNSLTYFISKILTSYNKCGVLPEFLAYVPWNVVSNSSNIFLNHEEIFNTTVLLKNYTLTNHVLPLNISKYNINMIQALDLYTSCIYNIIVNYETFLNNKL